MAGGHAPSHAAPRGGSAHRRAGPPITLAPDSATGGRRRAEVVEPGHQQDLPSQLSAPAHADDEPLPDPPTGSSPAAPNRWASSTHAPTASAVVAADGGPPVEAPPPSDDVLTTRDSEARRAAARAAAASTPSPALDLLADADAGTADALTVETAHAPVAEPTAWQGPIVTAAASRLAAGAVGSAAPDVEELAEAAPAEPPATRSPRARTSLALVVIGVVAAAVAGAQVAETEGWVDSVADPVVRGGALVSTWCAVVLLSRRCGGRTVVIGGFTAVVLALAGSFPETWALAGAAVTAGTVFGLLAMVYTRPARGLGLARELAISASIGVVGALVVAGYHVELRPYRFRMLVLGIALVGAFLLAWRLGQGARSIGRRGGVLILVGVVMLAGSLAYVQAVRSWGSPSLVQNLEDFKGWVTDLLGAAPRPVEALVGFPALVWGVFARCRRRQGWWMCAFGALGAAGITSSLVYPDVGLGSAMASTAYDVAIGLGVGLLVVFVDGVLTTGGGGRRADATRDADSERPEPARFTPLL
jgi:hypothetical protein